jgi:hypothetical protein
MKSLRSTNGPGKPPVGVVGGTECGYFETPNLKTVVERYSWPGRRMVDGKFEWLGESGKCCVSRHNP